MAAVLEAARRLARLGWPVMPVRPGAKQPLTKNGVKDATTDDTRIGQWWRKWPEANLGVACGHPGPQVLDIDDLASIDPEQLRDLEALGAPEVATTRGRHLYFAGTSNSTIGLGYGELRGRGSYVVAPPSIHPSGKEYVWLVEPNGAVLPAAPGAVARDRVGAGAGTREPVERVPHGERHGHLKDMAVRLVRSGITDAGTIERHLVAEYEAVCDKKPAALPGYFTKIAKWAATSDIAKREVQQARQATKETKTERTLPPTPKHDAPLGDLRSLVSAAGGVPEVLRIDEVIRFGNKPGDALHIKLSNGMRVEFETQREVTAPRMWQNAWVIATSGVCRPPTSLKGHELADTLWALCVISTTTAEQRFEDDLQQLVDDFLRLCEPVRGTLEDEGRYHLLGALADRPDYDVASGTSPTLVIDMQTGLRYVRAGELMTFADHRRFGISKASFAGRMRMIGMERVTIQAWDRTDRQRSDRRRAVLYRLPEEQAE